MSSDRLRQTLNLLLQSGGPIELALTITPTRAAVLAVLLAAGDGAPEPASTPSLDLESALQARLEQGQRSGDLPARFDTEAEAAFYASVVIGIVAAQTDGAAASKLSGIAHTALQAWPNAEHAEATMG